MPDDGITSARDLTASYTGWAVIYVLAAAGVAAFILHYFTHRSNKSYPRATTFALFLSILVCVAPFPLLILDVDAALDAKDRGFDSNPLVWAPTVWFIIFWGVQILAWGVLPMAQEYDAAGDYEVADRLKSAARINIKVYLILGVIGAVFLGYIMFLKGITNFAALYSLCLAGSNAFGLFLLVVFLACGLLGIPRLLWRMSDPKALLEESYHHVRNLRDELDTAKVNVTLLRREVALLDPKVTPDQRAHLERMMSEIGVLEKEVALTHTNIAMRDGATMENERKPGDLVSLHCDLKVAIKSCRRLHYQWETTLRECVTLSGIVTGQTRTIYWALVRKPLLRLFSIITGILTIVILYSESVIPFQSVDISLVENLLQNPSVRFIGASIILSYMAVCAFWATFQFHVFDIYVAVPGMTDTASMCFVVTFLTRLILPLCYNFLWMANLTHSKNNVAYSAFFGNMNVVKFLGEWFNQFMPVFIPILAVLIEMKVVHRFLQWVGVDGFETGEESVAARRQAIAEGRSMVAQYAPVELERVVIGGGAATASSSSSSAGAGGSAAAAVPSPTAGGAKAAAAAANAPAGVAASVVGSVTAAASSAGNWVASATGVGGAAPAAAGGMTAEKKEEIQKRYEEWRRQRAAAQQAGGAAAPAS